MLAHRPSGLSSFAKDAPNLPTVAAVFQARLLPSLMASEFHAVRLVRRDCRREQNRQGPIKAIDQHLPPGPGLSWVPEHVDSATYIFPVNLVDVGPEFYQRIGRQIQLQSLQLTGRLSCQPEMNASPPGVYSIRPEMVRVSVVYDRFPSPEMPLFSDIFGRTSGHGVRATSVWDPPRIENAERFIVLKDITMTQVPVAHEMELSSTTIPYWVIDLDETVDLQGLKTTFKAYSTVASYQNICSGALYVIFRSTRAFAGCYYRLFGFSARLRFSDP